MKKILLSILLLSCNWLYIAMAQDASAVVVDSVAAVGGKITKCGSGFGPYTLTAVPNVGYTFLQWIDGDTNPTRSFTYSDLSRNFFFRAVFTKDVDIVRDGGHSEVTVADALMPAYILTAVPSKEGACADAVAFRRWNDSSRTITHAYTEDMPSCVPIFQHQHHLDKYGHKDDLAGRIVVDTLECGFTLTAVPATDYIFLNWEDQSINPIRDVDYVEAFYRAHFGRIVARTSDTLYASVQTAVDHATDTVFLLASTTENVTIDKDVTLKGDNYQIGDVTITHEGILTLADTLRVNNLYLNTTQGQSSQLLAPGYLRYAHAYLDIRLEPELTAANAAKYYAVAVPSNVAVNSGITHQSAPHVPLIYMQDYVLYTYDGALRAKQKTSGWVRMEASETLQPGKFYMLGIVGTDNTWRFALTGDSLWGSSTLPVHRYDSDCPNKGWNALANTQLYHAQGEIDDIDYAQVYDNTSQSGKYDIVRFDEYAYVLAGPFFVQTEEETSLQFSKRGTQPYLHAPGRYADVDKVMSKVTLSNASQKDVLYLTARENASNSYQVGKDVVKMMGGTADSYIWANGYGYKLCAQDLPWDEGQAEFSVTLYAASAGVYSVSATVGYLYYQGVYVADLAEGAYTLTLTQGENTGYTILLGEKSMSTNLGKREEIRGKNEVYKTIWNEQLIIVTGESVYNAQGYRL